MADEVLFNRLALIGIGLIGSSIAWACRRDGVVGEIVCSARTAESRDKALALGIVDRAAPTNAEAVVGADLVIICTPVGAYGDVATEIAGHVAPGTIVSDVGSVKRTMLTEVKPRLADGVHIVPAHPVSGTEQSGPEAGFPELFDGRWCILTPPADADKAVVDKVADFWGRLGSKIEVMDAEHHDLVLAITSHVPHLIAYNIVGTAHDLQAVTETEVIKYSAGGFRDFTRLAASDPTMWRDVFLSNRDAVLEMLGRFSEDLSALQRAIRWGDGEALFDLFTRTREIRRAIIDAGQETPAPNFGRNGKPRR